MPLARLAVDGSLEELLEALCRALAADAAQLLLTEGAAIRVLASHGVPPGRVGDVAVPPARELVGRVLATRSPLAAIDARAPESFGPDWAGERVAALAAVPLVVADRVVGVAVVAGRRRAPFSDADVRALAEVAERAAWTVEHTLLLASERRALDTADLVTERLKRLQAISRHLLTDATVDGVVRTVVERGLSLVGAIAGGMWELDHDRAVLRLRGVVGYPGEVVDRWEEVPLDAAAPAAEAARTGQRLVLRSVAERDERYPALHGRASVGEAFVTAPLVVHGRTIGVIGLGFAHADDLDDSGLAFIDAAVAQCAAAMHRALVVEAQQRNLAQTRDAARRLGFLQRLTAALADARDRSEMADLIVEEVADALGATRVVLCLLDERRLLHVVRSFGISPEEEQRYVEFPVDATLPAADALLRREPIVLHDRAERDVRYPALAGSFPPEQALVTLPLAVGERLVGSLSLGLSDRRPVDEAELDFLTALADQCAHSLERARLLALESMSRRRLELLAEAGRIFSAPLDVRLTSLQFCRLVVGRVADAAAVYLRRPGGGYTLAANDHVDPAVRSDQREAADELPAGVVAAYDDVLERAEPLLLRPASGATSELLLPLIAGGHLLGVLVLGTVAGGHEPLGDVDAEHMNELAGRLALALDGARLLRQQTEIAHTLQRSLLPASLPQVPGAEVAVRYLPGAEGVDVGGDFYDVIPLPSGRVGLVVGDVMGRGVRAAAVMGQLRAAVRSYSLEGHPPAALLTRLDRLVGTLEEGLLVTAFYAEWDPGRGNAVCACAGHLPPLVRRPAAAPAYLDLDPGLPLGVGVQSYSELEVELPPGSLLLAFTDGLVEGPDLPVDEGMNRLVEAVAGTTGAMDACDAALAELRPLAAATRRYDDDTALLALVTHPVSADLLRPPDGDNVVSVDLPADTASPARARALVSDVLGRWGYADLVDPATLLASELVTNGVRHAGTGMRVALSRHAGRRVRVAVTDHAPEVAVRPGTSRDDAEGGRGLFLVEHLSAGWGSMADDAGKTVWFELQA